MNICSITYQPCGGNSYSEKGLKLLNPRLTRLEPFNYSAQEQLAESLARVDKMSIQGVQPKLSMKLNVGKSTFEIVDTHGDYILKPQHPHYPELPENENVSMKLAESLGIEIPVNGLLYAKDHTVAYFVKRFDRLPRNKKLHTEDFCQIAGLNRDTKYSYSMEKLIPIVEEYCTFPLLEKQKLFERVLFNWLIGNEDMHLKNYSLITRNKKVELSPGYDFLNSTIVIDAKEEIALPVAGKKSNLNHKDLIDYYGLQRLQLSRSFIDKFLREIQSVYPDWKQKINHCFLSLPMKEKYLNLLETRMKKML
jgi:serine/threonine-protein kinase HipA